ncbi:SAYSvFN domain-containing protein 1 [Euwallacea fornicatus]|uniref:SAYSvFN domain-containing protein 1 n=1 Tax=Euwallacea fornicatus TaxID=995702 RepID=UPI00339059AD
MPLTDTEAKLTDYRTRKEREKLINHYKTRVATFFSKFTKKPIKFQDSVGQEKFSPLVSTDSNLGTKHDSLLIEKPTPLSIYDYLLYVLSLLLWITVYAIFIKLQFGMVYLIISALVGMYLNTRTGPKEKNEVSAYSVFNENCEKIDGTLDGEQMTKQMLYGQFAK